MVFVNCECFLKEGDSFPAGQAELCKTPVRVFPPGFFAAISETDLLVLYIAPCVPFLILQRLQAQPLIFDIFDLHLQLSSNI